MFAGLADRVLRFLLGASATKRSSDSRARKPPAGLWVERFRLSSKGGFITSGKQDRPRGRLARLSCEGTIPSVKAHLG